MRNLLDKIFKSNLPSYNENRVYRLFNILIIVNITLVFLIALYLWYIQAYPGLYICLIEVAIFLFLFVLHVKGYHTLPRYIFFIIAISAQVYGSLFHGENAGIDFFFFITAISPVLFFEKKWQYFSLFILSISCLVMVKYLYVIVTPIDPFVKNNLIPYFFNATLTGFLIYTLYELFKKDHLKYEQSLNNQKEEITEQKEKLSKLKDQLEDLLESRTERVQKQNESIRKYAFMNAHEVRSPLARILGLVNLTSMEDMSHDETRRYYMKELKVNAYELDNIISEMNNVLFQETEE